ncbi:MAG: N-6 DNA methylase [Steroidobacteraceae bacterium]|nr:N-6 DNA methylase [Steroidobacteraceae bacterium]
MRRPTPRHFESLSIEGGLLPPDWLARVAALDAGQMTAADYRVPPGLQLRDEISRFWRIGEALWADFVVGRAQPGHSKADVTERFICELLRQALRFDSLRPALLQELVSGPWPVPFSALVGRVPIVVGPWDRSLDAPDPAWGDGTRRRSAFGLVQEFLNAAPEALWGIASNGLVLRVARDNASLTRPAWIEVDLERLFTERRFADFSALWLLLHESRFGRAGHAPQECPLEAWRAAALSEGTRARESLRAGVEAALEALGGGFLQHPVNAELRSRLADGRLTAHGYFQQLLRLVYRLIFLFTVEDRGLLHPPGTPEQARALYAAGYALGRLRERAIRRRGFDRHDDLWRGLAPVFRGLARGEPVLGLPALGGLFAAEQCADLDAAALGNGPLLETVFRLAWLRDPATGAVTRINWRDMGPEEFGSVYESLLELEPEVAAESREFGFAGDGGARGSARKLTGSYYTPDGLVQLLLDSALEPVIAARLAAHPADADAALLGLAVVDPACGSGHFLLAAARRIAGHLARHRAGGTPTPAEFRYALRDVISYCVFGVDLNPMALELARIALWLEAFTPDRPLSFLDHHLQCGNALLGLMDLRQIAAGIPDEAYRPLTGDERGIAQTLARRNREARRQLERVRDSGQHPLDFSGASLGRALAEVDEAAEVTLDEVAAKERKFAALAAQAAAGPLAVAADLSMAAWLLPQTGATQARVPTTADLVPLLDGFGATDPAIVAAARAACREASVLHWPLAFPQVFARGGFDCVLGNPPWERLKIAEQEFFAARAPEIAAAPNAAARRRLIEALAEAAPGSADRRLWDAFVAAKQAAEAASQFAHGPRYPLTGVGDVNSYALFAETALSALGPTGRAGLVLPSGIATDDSTKLFFAHAAQGRLAELIDFENSEPIFPSVHRSYKFCLLTLGAASEARFGFFLTRVEQASDPRRRFTLGPEDLARLNPNTRTCPIFRSRRDAEIATAVYRRVPVLWDESREDGNPWGISFLRMFDMSNDSGLFCDAPGGGLVPLYEAKMAAHYDHRWATYVPGPEGRPETADVSAAQKRDPAFAVTPRYWVDEAEVRERLAAKGWNRDWLLGFRDICRATDERTVIASVIPAVGVGNNLPVALCDTGRVSAGRMAALLGNLSALVLDFLARHKVGGTHLNFFILKQLAVLPPERLDAAALDFIVPRVLELAYTAHDLQPFYEDLVAENPAWDSRPAGERGRPFPWDDARRARLRAELDAWFALAYGLDRDELRYVLDPADVMGADYPSETFRVLKERELRELGEYRTRRLVLEAWDRP